MKLDFAVLPHQKEFLKSNENTMIAGGYGSAKSHAGTLKTIMKKLQYKDKKVAYYLPHYGLVRDIAFDKFPTLLESLGLKYKLNKSDKEIMIDNYGSILFRSMDNPETIVGYEVAYSLIDEADILPMDKMEQVYQKILARNRAVANGNVDAVSTPEGFKWLYQQSRNGHFKLIKASTYDNKFLPPDYIAQLEKQYPPNLLRAYLYGEFVNLTSGTVYSYFDRAKHHRKIKLEEHEVLHIGQDFNIGGCVSTVHVIRGDEVYRIKDIVSKDSFHIVPNIKKIFNNKFVIYPDASGNASKTNATKSDIQILKDDGATISASSTNPRVQDRVNTLNSLLYQEKYFIDCDECEEGAQALEQQAYDKNGEPEKYGGAATIDDYNDSTGYFIYKKFAITKVRYNVTKNILR